MNPVSPEAVYTIAANAEMVEWVIRLPIAYRVIMVPPAVQFIFEFRTNSLITTTEEVLRLYLAYVTLAAQRIHEVEKMRPFLEKAKEQHNADMSTALDFYRGSTLAESERKWRFTLKYIRTFEMYLLKLSVVLNRFITQGHDEGWADDYNDVMTKMMSDNLVEVNWGRNAADHYEDRLALCNELREKTKGVQWGV